MLVWVVESDEFLPLDFKTPLFYTKRMFRIPVIAGGDLRSRLRYGDYPRTINDDWGIRLL